MSTGSGGARPLAAAPPEYQPGVCNIGPAEVAIRERLGHVGAATTAALYFVLLRARARRGWRLLLFLPATGAAAAYLEARSGFCLAYGWRGVLNLDRPAGRTSPVAEAAARRADRRRALRMVLSAGAAGAAVTLLATAS